jgi:hypothetical protein
MPNGGSDCCGTCPFNRKNRGEAGYAHARDPGPDHCDIRDLPITHSFSTYCANHPHHNPGRLAVPIGPVWVGTGGFPYGREISEPGPDTPEVRAEVLRLLAAATPDPISDYPGGFAITEAAIRQAGELGDARFIPYLERIRQFPGLTEEQQREETFARDPTRSARFAAESLARILPPDAITPCCSENVRAVAATVDQSGDVGGLPILADALQEAGCTHAATLDYLRSPEVRVPCWVVDVILGRVTTGQQ